MPKIAHTHFELGYVLFLIPKKINIHRQTNKNVWSKTILNSKQNALNEYFNHNRIWVVSLFFTLSF